MAMSRWRGALSVTSIPPIDTVPPVTSSRPAIIRKSVDLPHPDGPTSTMNWPSGISRLTSSTATTSPENTFVTRSRRMSATCGLPAYSIQNRSGIDHWSFLCIDWVMARTDQDELVTEARGGTRHRPPELIRARRADERRGRVVAPAVRQASAQIAEAIDSVVSVSRRRAAAYVGAGSSGAIAALDAAECETTFALPTRQSGGDRRRRGTRFTPPSATLPRTTPRPARRASQMQR